MRKLVLVLASLITMLATNAMAESIANRFGVSAKIGAMMPFKDDFIKGTSETSAGFAAGGGLIYGFSDLIAADVEVLHMPQLDVKSGGVKTFEAALTDVALGVQFRFLNKQHIVPYVGLGPDFITADLKHVNGTSYKLDWTYGGHVNVGADWFITPGIAMNVDLRGVYAADGDVVKDSTLVSEYRPQWFMGTIGVRLFLPEKF